MKIFKFVSIDDFPFYMRWGNAGVTNLNHIMDTVTKNFLTFEKIKTLIQVFLPISKIFEWEDELMSSVK
jgi:hypothetical protein